jgi:hypothetical protein
MEKARNLILKLQLGFEVVKALAGAQQGQLVVLAALHICQPACLPAGCIFAQS